MEESGYFMSAVGDRQGEGQGTKCHAGNETEAEKMLRNVEVWIIDVNHYL